MFTILLLIMLILNMTSGDSYVPLGKCDSEIYCCTEECLQTAKAFLKYMKNNTNPCDDFYTYACGRYHNTSSEQNEWVTVIKELQVKFNHIVEKLLLSNYTKNDTLGERKVKTIYSTCIRNVLIQEDDSNTIKVLLNSMGGWPVISQKWKEATMIEVLLKMIEHGFMKNKFIEIKIKEGNWPFYLVVSRPNTYVSSEDNFEDAKVQKYYNLSMNVAMALGADKDNARNDMRSVIDLELAIAKLKITNGYEDYYDSVSDPSTSPQDYGESGGGDEEVKPNENLRISDLEIKFPNFPWVKYIKGVLKPYMKYESNITVKIYDEPYLMSFGEILKNSTLRTLSNYLMWNIISDSIEKYNVKIGNATSGLDKKEINTALEKCWVNTKKSFPIEIATVYMRGTHTEKHKEVSNTLASTILDEFHYSMDNVGWMDNITRVYANYKAKNIKLFVDNFSDLKGYALKDELYKDLNVSSHSNFLNQLSIIKYERSFPKDFIRESMNESIYNLFFYTANVNGFYSEVSNAMVIAPSYLQGIMFGVNRTKYLNFGGIGTVIGHEIFHGFDTLGIHYSADGKIHEWVRNDTMKIFKSKAQCFIEQYGNITIPEIGKKLNGTRTLDENIADIAGTKLAYHAYERWVTMNSPEKPLPGLNLTLNQLFWLQVANVWCEKNTLSTLLYRVTRDTHAPGKQRVNIGFQNLFEFSKDWNCPLNSTMNPYKKCILW